MDNPLKNQTIPGIKQYFHENEYNEEGNVPQLVFRYMLISVLEEEEEGYSKTLDFKQFLEWKNKKHDVVFNENIVKFFTDEKYKVIPLYDSYGSIREVYDIVKQKIGKKSMIILENDDVRLCIRKIDEFVQSILEIRPVEKRRDNADTKFYDEATASLGFSLTGLFINIYIFKVK